MPVKLTIKNNGCVICVDTDSGTGAIRKDVNEIKEQYELKNRALGLPVLRQTDLEV